MHTRKRNRYEFEMQVIENDKKTNFSVVRGVGQKYLYKIIFLCSVTKQVLSLGKCSNIKHRFVNIAGDQAPPPGVQNASY